MSHSSALAPRLRLRGYQVPLVPLLVAAGLALCALLALPVSGSGVVVAVFVFLAAYATFAAIEILMDRQLLERQMRSLAMLERFNHHEIVQFRRILREHVDEVDSKRRLGAPVNDEGEYEMLSQRGVPELAQPILGLMEDLAIAVRVGALDEEVLRRALALIICDVFEGLGAYISWRRKLVRFGNPTLLYCEMEWLYQRWKLERR